jgi:hypothetical protein
VSLPREVKWDARERRPYREGMKWDARERRPYRSELHPERHSLFSTHGRI